MNRTLAALIISAQSCLTWTAIAQAQKAEQTSSGITMTASGPKSEESSRPVTATSTQATRATPTPDPNQPSTAGEPDSETSMTREERIKAHHERITRIIQENRSRQGNAQRSAKNGPGAEGGNGRWVVRVAEKLSDIEQTRLLRQLKQDGFGDTTALSETVRLPDDNRFGHNIVLIYSSRSEAMIVEQRLRGLGYQFGTITYGRIVEELPDRKPTTSTIIAPEPIDKNGNGI